MGRRNTRSVVYRPKVGRSITDPNTNITYFFQKVIGTSGLDFVYKAAVFSRDKHNNKISTGYATVKYLRKGNPDIRTSFNATGEISTRYVINIESWFIKRFEDNGYLVGLPYMSEGSLRYILSSNFYYGLPEDCIAIALKEALIGLLDIHNSGRIHKYFSAGNIFVHNSKAGGEIKIKLAFGAAGYDSDPHFKVNKEVNAGDSSVPPLTNISAWAAAPEIYYTNEDSDSGDIENDYSVKSDIWLVGITALELAYGNIRVSDREDFDEMINKIRQSKKLPNRLEDLFEEITYPIEEEEKNDRKMKKVVGFFKDKLKLGKGKEGDNLVEEISDKKGKMKKVMGFIKEKVGKKKEEEKGLFSKEFEKVVLDCLAEKPRKRPNVQRLLSQPFFENAKDKNWFQRSVLHAKNPKPITSDSDSDCDE